MITNMWQAELPEHLKYSSLVAMSIFHTLRSHIHPMATKSDSIHVRMFIPSHSLLLDGDDRENMVTVVLSSCLPPNKF